VSIRRIREQIPVIYSSFVGLDQEVIEREVRLEIEDLSKEDLPREVLIETIAHLWTNYQALHALYEDLAEKHQALSAEVIRHVNDTAAAARAGADAAAQVSRRQDWHEDARQLWASHPDWSINAVAKEIAKKHSRSGYEVSKRSVMRSIEPVMPATSPSFKG